MMHCRVVVEPEAIEDIGNAYLWIAMHSPAAAVKWFNGLTKAMPGGSRAVSARPGDSQTAPRQASPLD